MQRHVKLPQLLVGFVALALLIICYRNVDATGGVGDDKGEGGDPQRKKTTSHLRLNIGGSGSGSGDSGGGGDETGDDISGSCPTPRKHKRTFSHLQLGKEELDPEGLSPIRQAHIKHPSKLAKPEERRQQSPLQRKTALNNIGDIEISTNLGRLRGLVVRIDPMFLPHATKSAPHLAHVFLGVPYSEPVPRFEKPIPVKRWSGVKDATFDGPASVPYMRFGQSPYINYSEEHCMNIDIYKPADDRKNHPVLFYIHGGGFEIGSPRNYPKNPLLNMIASQGIVLVMVSYRLGLFGFGTNGQPDFAGNLGLWDQAEALRWVKANIAIFGGDPNNITVGGNSAGGVSASALSISTHTRDLFQKVVTISGSIFCGWGFSREWVVEETKTVADAVGCGDRDIFYNSDALKKCLRAIPVEKIWQAVYFSGHTRADLYSVRFHPRFDGDFFVEEPELLMQSAPPKPTFTGISELEMLVYALTDLQPIIGYPHIGPQQWKLFNEDDLSNYVRQQLAIPRYYGSQEVAKEIQNRIVNFYKSSPRDVYSAECENAHLKNAVDIASDVLFNMPSIIEAKKKAELGWPVYFYLYTFWDKEHTIRQMPLRGATHAAEQYHWFGRPVYAIVDPFPPEHFSPDEATFINFSLNSLLQFVRTGNPTFPEGSTTTNANLMKWPLVKPTGPLEFVQLDTQPEVRVGLWEETYTFWQNLRHDFPGFDAVWANGAPSFRSTPFRFTAVSR